MTAHELLAECERRGITLSLAGGDRIRYSAPPGAMTDELKALVTRHKGTLLWILAARASPAQLEFCPFCKRHVLHVEGRCQRCGAEAVAIAKALEPVKREAARERQEATRAKPGQKVSEHLGAGKLPEPNERGQTRDRVARYVGMSGRTLDGCNATRNVATHATR